MKKIITLTLMALFAITNANAIEAITQGQVLSIEDCVSAALDNSPQIKMYENQKSISKAQVSQAKSAYAPTIGVGTGYYDTYDVKYSDNSNYYSLNFSVQQLLYNFGKTGAKIKSQKYNLMASEYNLENIILETTHNVKLAYYEVLAAKANREIQNQNVSINMREYERTKAFFEEGLKSKIDLVNAEVNLSESKIQLVNAENDYQNALIKLNNSMFIVDTPNYEIKNTESFNIQTPAIPVSLDNVTNAEELAKLPEGKTVYEAQVEKQELLMNYEFKPYKVTLEEAIQKAYENRPDLKALTSTVSAMEESLKYAKREYLPELTGRAGYTLRDSSSYTNSSFNFSAGLDIASLNIFSTKARIEEAKAQVELAKNNLDLLKKNIYFEVQDAYVDMQQLEKRIPLLATKVRQTLENYELADGRYEVGLGNFLELQDAKNNYNNAQLNFVQAVFQYNTSKVKVEKAMGEK